MSSPAFDPVMLRIELMGRPHWRHAGDDPGASAGRPLWPQDAALVAVLALEGPQPRDTLAGRLWPRATPLKAANNLRQRVSRLRRETGCAIFDTGRALRLRDEVALDLQELDALGCERLLAMGEFLGGCDFGDNEYLEAWLRRQRQRLRRTRADALAGHADLLERRGELAAALRLAEATVALAPIHEHAWRRLMRLHYRRGDRAAAIDAFERFEALLREESGARPNAETLALLQTIEAASQAAPAARLLVPVSLLRPPLRVGRELEWQAMGRAWAAGRPFLLIGEAGLGKSRLLGDQAEDLGPQVVIADRARPGDARTPGGLLARVVRAAQAGTARALADDARADPARLWPLAEAALQAAVAQGLRAILLDDLHFADTATLEALRWLAASPALASLRFGLACRPLAAGPAADLLGDWLADSVRPERIALGPLSVPEMEALVASLGLAEAAVAGLGRHLHAHTGGHPLFALETLKDAWLEGGPVDPLSLPRPARVMDLLERQLRDLSPAARTLMRCAAAARAGVGLNPDRAAVLLGLSTAAAAAACGELERAGVLHGGRLAHPLIEALAARDLSGTESARLHAQWALLLAGEDAPPHQGAASLPCHSPIATTPRSGRVSCDAEGRLPGPGSGRC